MNDSYDDGVISLRASKELLRKIDKVVVLRSDLYTDRSHLVRVAVIKLLREHGEGY